MDIESARIFCLGLPQATECLPFDDVTLVFKIAGKMFALLSLESEDPGLLLKCDPELAIELRERYRNVLPGFHMNKKYWNTVLFSGGLKDELIEEWIIHSYTEVVNKLPKITKVPILAELEEYIKQIR